MKAIGLTESGGPEVLHVVTRPSPEPGPGEVRIRPPRRTAGAQQDGAQAVAREWPGAAARALGA